VKDVMSAEVFDALAGLQHGTLKMVHARHERDKRMFYCTLKYVDQPANLDEIKKAVAEVVDANRDKAIQVREKPSRIGWFVGQTMKLLNGTADPELVCFQCNEELCRLGFMARS
jgi:Asp-tRNA(Asn)/Glu-tRNA(Gln) amidotransferase B subunit